MKNKCRILFLYGLCISNLFLFSDAMGKVKVQEDNFSSCQLLSEPQIQKLKSPDIHFYKLSNGLRVYIKENHQLPVFSLRLTFSVGASDEMPGEGGYAHLFEHMMFKGSKNVADGEHFSAIKSFGGHVNAATDYDQTYYWTDAPVGYLDQILWLEAERWKNLEITEANLENQRQAILEEKLLRIDNVPYFKVASEFMISAWQGTDYDHLIIGSDEEIKQSTVAKIQKFFNQFYHPTNAIMTLVGDIDPELAIKKIKQSFLDESFAADSIGHINLEKKQSLSTPFSLAHKSQLTINDKQGILSGKSETQFDPLAPFPLYALGWHTVGKNNPDFYAVELLADILLNHDASRLKQQLKEEQDLVFETIGFPLTFEKAGITAMGMVPHSYADFSQIKDLIRTELIKLRQYGVSPAELCSAKKHRQLLILKKMNNNRKMAELIADGVLFFNDPWHSVSALQAYENVNNEQIQAVASHYFHEDWLALEIVPGPGVRLLKWLMEIMPQGISRAIEQQFL